MVFAIKMLLGNVYGLLNLLEFKCYHFNGLFQAESEFKNSNFGGKSSELLIQCRFSKKFDFSRTLYLLLVSAATGGELFKKKKRG